MPLRSASKSSTGRRSISRKQIIRSAKTQRGWSLHPAALSGIEDLFTNPAKNHQFQGRDAASALEEVWDFLTPYMKDRSTLTIEVWNQVTQGTTADDENDGQDRNSSRTSSTMETEQNASGTEENPIRVISATVQPKLLYHSSRKQFQWLESHHPTLFGSAQDKVNMLLQRYQLTHQRILRHELFRPSTLSHLHSDGSPRHSQLERNQQLTLTSLENLLGLGASGSRGQAPSRLLLGMLMQLEEGQWYLEDPTAMIPLQLDQAVLVDDNFCFSGCFQLVEGVWDHDTRTFCVQRMGPPLLETRQQSPARILQTPSNGHESIALDAKPRFVILHDLFMDQPRAVQQLEALLSRYESQPPRKPRKDDEDSLDDEIPEDDLISSPLVFCILGSLSSPSSSSSHSSTNDSQTQGLSDFVSLVGRHYPRLAAHAHFVLLAAPHDPNGNILWPRLWPSSAGRHQRGITNLHLASNPCRITWAEVEQTFDRRHGGSTTIVPKEMVLFRHPNLSHVFGRHALHLRPAATDQERSAPYEAAVETVLNQGHLLPLVPPTVFPIYWNLDHALRLYPLPNVLVWSGPSEPQLKQSAKDTTTPVPSESSSSWFTHEYGDCHILGPGNWSQRGEYVIYDESSVRRNESRRSRRETTDDEEDDDVSMGETTIPDREAMQLMRMPGFGKD